MRRVIVGMLAATVACGGDGDSGSQPPPPPPPVPVATTVAVAAGDNQSAAAGTAVATPPAALVRDQTGRPMAGVEVAFAVEAGDGSITGASGTTGADGIARVGSWLVGPGANKLKATAGTLTPVFWSATGTGELIVPLGEVTPAGGVLTVRRPGTPIDSLIIRVPAGAYAGPVSLQVQYGDSTGRPSKPGLSFASPVLTLSSNFTGYTKSQPLTIEVPVRLTAGTIPVGVMFDRATGAMDVVPAVALSGSRVAILTRHLDGGRLGSPSSGGASLRAIGGSLRNNGLVQIVIGQVSYASIAGDITTSYDPAVDNWEFPYYPLGSDVSSSLRVGYALTALSYFRTQRTTRGPLRNRFQEAKGVIESNPRGIKASALASDQVKTAGVTAYHASLALLAQQVGGPTLDSLVFVATKAAMYLTGQPQLFLADQLGSKNPSFTYVVYGSKGNDLKVTLGTTDPVPSQDLHLVGGKFGTNTFGYVDPATGSYVSRRILLDYYVFAGPSAGVPFAAVDTLWPHVVARTIAPSWPKVRWAPRGSSRVSGDTIFIWADSNRVGLVCDSCDYSFTPNPPSGFSSFSPLLGHLGWEESASTWVKHPGFYRAPRMVYRTPQVARFGVAAILAPLPGDIYPRYHDWTLWTLKFVKLDIASVPAGPQPLNVYEGATFTLSATFSDPLPPSPLFVWDLGGGRRITTTTPMLSTTYPPPAAAGSQRSYTVTCTLLDGSGTVHATADYQVLVKEPPPAWRVDSVRVSVAGPPSQDQSGYSNLVAAFMTGLSATPAAHYLVVHSGLDNAGVVHRSAIIQRAAPDAPITLVGLNTNALALAATGKPGRSLVLGPLGNGTLVGQSSFSDPGDPDCPSCYQDMLNSISATMTPGRVSGTFSVSAIGPVYTVRFWATQVVP